MVQKRMLHFFIACALVLSALFGQASSIASSSARSAVLADLLEGSSVRAPVHAVLQAERARLRSQAPLSVQRSLANLSLPLPPEVRELADRAAASQKVTKEQAERSAQQLNEMLLEQHHLLDLKVIDCREKRRRTGEAIQDAAKDVRSLASETSSARSVIMDASARIPQDKRAFEEFKVEAQIGRLRCQDDGQTDKVAARSLERDATTIAALQVALSKQCKGMVSFVQLPRDVVADAESSLQEVHMLNSKPIDIRKVDDAYRPGEGVDDVIQRAEGTLHHVSIMPIKKESVFAHAQKESVFKTRSCAEMAASLGVVAMKRGRHASAAFLEEVQPLQCKLNQQTCAAMLDMAAEVGGEIADSQARLRASAARGRQVCKDEDLFSRNQLSMESNQASDRSRELGEATSKAGEAGDTANQKDSHRQTLQAELKAITAKCTAEVSDILYGKMCAMQKVRDSLQILSGSKQLPEDCQVTDFDEGVCSATCGGGVKTLSRQVILSPKGGAACPALKLQRQCGETECPSDCDVSRWNDWSACSARCDGGVQERNRVVTTGQVGNGVACPHLVDMRLCNTERCSSSCELLEWTPWTPCSKACGSGTEVRSRGLKDEGKVSCPSTESKERLELQACNEDQCEENTESRCAGYPMDVVLLLDASGSITAPGFASLKSLSLELAQRYSPSKNGTRLSVATFAKEAVAISSLSDDSSRLASTLSSDLQWLQGPGNAGAGLSRAASLLATGGRKTATSLIVMVTDGRLVDPFLARQAADKLKRNGARLALALVGTDYKNSDLLSSMASVPAKDNIIQLPGFLELADNIKLTANRIVTSTCSAVV